MTRCTARAFVYGLYSLFYKYVNMSYFDGNELICICVVPPRD